MKLTALVRKLGFVRQLETEIQRLGIENDQLRHQLSVWERYHPPGHFYSPLPSASEAAEALQRVQPDATVGGIELRESDQKAVLESIAEMYPELAFPEQPQEGFRYHLENGSYGAFDGIMLYGMLRRLQPRRVVEIGSGYSSAAMLDVSDRFLRNRLKLTVIDPDTSRLRSLLWPSDLERVTLIEQRVQDVDLDLFDALEDRDVLFVDSSHVSKVGSDVNHLVFQVLPRLKPGVRVHFHDVMAGFEYPREWFEEGRAWNEQYLIRAFLMYNRAFSIELWSGWLFHSEHEFLRHHMPRCVQGGGGQIWLRRDSV